MRFDWWTFALQTVNFAVLVWLLHRFLYQPILRMIDARKAQMQQQADAAKAVADQAAARLAEVEAQRAGIAAEREAALKAAGVQAQEAAQARRRKAEHEAQAIVDAARLAVAQERERAAVELRHGALDLGAEFARRLLAEVPVTLRAEAWSERIERALQELTVEQRNSLATQLASGDALSVVTASPLPPPTAELWRERLRRQLGERVAVTFGVDPDLVAGAELHFPTTVLSFSWRSALQSMRAEIDDHGDAG
jgi:F-type H+-transporting ATPase subunit b